MDFDDLKKSNDDRLKVNPPNPNINPNVNPNYVNKHFPPPSPPPQPLMQPAGYPMEMGPYHHHEMTGYPYATPSFKLNYSPSFNSYGGPWRPDQNMYSNDEANKFGRVMLAMMVTIISLMCILSMVIWSLFSCEVATLEVRSLSISNMTTEGHMFQANWDIDMVVLNPNTYLRLHPGLVHVAVIYENAPLAVSLVDPLVTDEHHEFDLRLKLENVSRPCEEEITTEIVKDKKGGTMFIGMHVGLGAKISSTTSPVWRKDALKVWCDELKIDFASDGTGALSVDSPKGCLLDP